MVPPTVSATSTRKKSHFAGDTCHFVGGSGQTARVTYLVRASVFILLFLVVLTVSEFGVDPWGLGLAMFAAFVLIATVWGVLDGRAGAALPAVVTWFLVALTVGVVMPLGTSVVNDEWSLVTMARDALATLPFILLLVFPPALMGIGIGSFLRRGRTT